MQIEFVFGHCGWDSLTLLPEGQIPPQLELAAALKIIDPPIGGGLEVGFLGKSAKPDEIRMRMVSGMSRDWMPMCGGMTQVAGKALVETFLRTHFGIDTSLPSLALKLLTPAGVIPIKIKIEAGRASAITTVVDDYVASLYREGIESSTLEGCDVLRIGEFLIMEIEALERWQPGVDFTRRDDGPHLQLINALLEEHMRRQNLHHGAVSMLYDRSPGGSGRLRLYPRFYSPDNLAARIPYEFQCGAGTTAVGVALASRGMLAPDGEQDIIFEWGNPEVTPDPYGVRTSRLGMILRNGRVVGAEFSHSVVEILAEGLLTLPNYG